MQEFIQSAVSQLGISQDSAESATGTVLNLLKDQGGGGATNQLLSALPGADALMGSTASSSGGGGLAGGLGAVSSAFGGKMGGAAGALAALQGSGLGADKIGSFVSLFFDFAKQKAGAGLVDQALEQVPDLKGLLG